MPSGVSPQPALAAAIAVALLAGIAVAVVRPGDLGGDGRLDASRPTTTTTTTTTTPVAAPAPEPGGTEAPGTTVPVPGSGTEGAGGTATTTPGATTAPVPGTPSSPAPTTPPTTSRSRSGSPVPAPTTAPTGASQPSGTLAHTGEPEALAPLAVVLLLAGTVGRLALRSSAPCPRLWRQQRSGN